MEVISPSTRTIDLVEKAQDYALAGVAEYWAVDRERGELFLHRLEEKGYRVERSGSGRVEGLSLPGFWLEAGWLFRESLPPAEECLRTILER